MGPNLSSEPQKVDYRSHYLLTSMINGLRLTYTEAKLLRLIVLHQLLNPSRTNTVQTTLLIHARTDIMELNSMKRTCLKDK